MGSKLSRKELIKDNTEMLGTIKWMQRVMDEQLAANIALSLEVDRLKLINQQITNDKKAQS